MSVGFSNSVEEEEEEEEKEEEEEDDFYNTFLVLAFITGAQIWVPSQSSHHHCIHIPLPCFVITFKLILLFPFSLPHSVDIEVL